MSFVRFLLCETKRFLPKYVKMLLWISLLLTDVYYFTNEPSAPNLKLSDPNKWHVDTRTTDPSGLYSVQNIHEENNNIY